MLGLKSLVNKKNIIKKMASGVSEIVNSSEMARYYYR